MRGLVLAAGFATRLYPLTRDRAKPLLDVGGRPVLSRLLDRLAGVELSELCVVTNGRFHDQFEAWRAAEERPYPIRLVNDGAQDAEHRLGAVRDMALGLDSMPDGDEGVMVLAGDNLVDFDFAPYARTFQAVGRPLLLVRTLSEPPPPLRFGEVQLDNAGNVVRFREKPADPRSRVASTCLYFFPPDIRAWVAEFLESGGDGDAPGFFLEWLVAKVRVAAMPIEGTLHDIGNLDSLEAARRAFAE